MLTFDMSTHGLFLLQIHEGAILARTGILEDDGMASSKNEVPETPRNNLKLKKLTVEQVQRIDALLASIRDYGEVHLVVQRGELRYINKMESHRAEDGGDGE